MIVHYPNFVFPEGVKANRPSTAADKALCAREIWVRYTMLTFPEGVTENRVITAMLVPKTGRAL